MPEDADAAKGLISTTSPIGRAFLNREEGDTVKVVTPGGPRQFMTPYGVEIMDQPELKKMYFMSGGGPRTWRVVYMDGRPHPKGDDVNPS